jgi:hypothetical protein
MASPRIVFDHQMVAPAQGGSPSAAKPAAVVAAWRQAWPDSEVRAPQPVSRADLSRAHDHCYVDDVLALRVPNGFGTVSAVVAASLLYTSGALLTASRWLAAGRCLRVGRSPRRYRGSTTLAGIMVVDSVRLMG